MRRDPNGGIRHKDGEYDSRRGLLRFLLTVGIVVTVIVAAIQTGVGALVADALGDSIQPGGVTEPTPTPTPRPHTNTSGDWRLSINRSLDAPHSEDGYRDWELIWEVQREVLRVINAQRAERGVEPLFWNTDLSVLNRWHAKNVHDYDNVVHTNERTGRSPRDRAEWVDYGQRCYVYSEVITTAGIAGHLREENKQADDIVENWMYSRSHRKAILDERVDVAGVGIFIDKDGGMYAVMTMCDRQYIADDELDGWEDARYRGAEVAVPYEVAVEENPGDEGNGTAS